MEWIVIKISRSWIKHFKLNSKILIVIVRNVSKFCALFFFFFLFLFRFTIFVVRLIEKQFAWFASVRNEDVPSNGQVATNHNLYVHSMVGLNRYASNNKRSRSTIIFWNFSRLSSYYIYVYVLYSVFRCVYTWLCHRMETTRCNWNDFTITVSIASFSSTYTERMIQDRSTHRRFHRFVS